jgi:hypothetical protein
MKKTSNDISSPTPALIKMPSSVKW